MSGDVSLAAQSRPNGGHQVARSADLGHVAERAGRVSASWQLGVVMDRDEHHARGRTSGEERPHGHDPVASRHHDVW
jgi:hypothetical protein